MRNTVFFVLSVCLLLACGNNGGYVIEGRYSSAPDGTKLYLVAFDDILDVVDSAEVKDGHFLFKGKCDTLSVCFLSSSRVIDGGYVLLEPGRIQFDFESEIKCSGTPLNNVVARFMEEKEEVEELCMMTSPEMMDKVGLDKIMADSLQRMSNVARSIFAEFAMKQVKENLGNPLGAFLLVNSVGAVPSEFIAAMSELIPDKYQGRLFKAKMKQVGHDIALLSYAAEADSAAVATAVGKKYQNFELKNLTNENILMSDRVSVSEYTLLCFWAGWNDKSLKDIETLKKIYAGYARKGFDIVGVSLDRSVEQCRLAVNAHGIEWLQLCNPGGGSAELAAAYGVANLPVYILINNQGTIIQRTESVSDIATKLAEVLGQMR